MKYPTFAVKEVFYKIVNKPCEVTSSQGFIHRGDCPLCNDKRQRMYLKDYGDDYMIYCHNCAYSNSFHLMLKDYFPSDLAYLRQFMWDSIKSGKAFVKEKKRKRAENKLKPFNYMDMKLRTYRKSHGFHILEEQDNPKKERYRKMCLEYIINRKLPLEFYEEIYCMTKGPLKGYFAIPFWDRKKENLIHLQGRRMFVPKSKDEERFNPKYKFLKDKEKNIEIENKPLWGLHRLNLKNPVIITEGAPDAQCFDNGCATCGASISRQFLFEIKKSIPRRIWVPDNVWVDKAGQQLTSLLLNNGERCFIMPMGISEKDANAYIIANGLDSVPDDFILENIYEGKLGLAHLKTLAWGAGLEWQERQNMRSQR